MMEDSHYNWKCHTITACQVENIIDKQGTYFKYKNENLIFFTLHSLGVKGSLSLLDEGSVELISFIQYTLFLFFGL